MTVRASRQFMRARPVIWPVPALRTGYAQKIEPVRGAAYRHRYTSYTGLGRSVARFGFTSPSRPIPERAREEPGSAAPYWLVVLRGGVRYSEMVLEWCDESERMLRDLPEPGAAGDPDQGACTEEDDR